MARTTALADIDDDKVAMFRHVLKGAGAPDLASILGIDVAALRAVAPTLLICDIDFVDKDRLETLRQLRFVLPTCVIVVYTLTLTRSWGLQCHLAGANGVLSKTSTERELSAGVSAALRVGCFTDPRLAVA
jgi:DNA-binding NarL/FixJ family response regulator